MIMSMNLMKKYQIQNSTGSGNFSTVYKGVVLPELTPCAVKILQSHHKIALRQAQLLNKFKHPNIISIMDFYQNERESHIILQYLGINTLQLYQSHPNGLKEEQVKCILFQTALGLSFVHSFKIIHRDVKPQNILIDKKQAIVKLIDFGLAIQQTQSTTDYIATRWYRAPENLLGTKQYTCAIDVFSLACVIVQLYLGVPLFPGSNNLQQIFKIFSVLGYPTAESWPKGYQKIQQLGINTQSIEKNSGTGIRQLMKGCNIKLVLVLQKMLQLNPKTRITCVQLLKNQYFKDIKNIVPSFIYKRYQQDILSVKTITFKGFQPVKCSKNISNETHPKSPKINFHQVTGKTRNSQQIVSQICKTNTSSQNPQQLQSIEQNNSQGPKLLRQHKSTSLDSYQPNLQIINIENKKPGQNQNVNPLLQDVNSVRKLSTPTSISNLKLNISSNLHLQNTQYLQKINSPSQFFNFKQPTHKIPLDHPPIKFSFQDHKRKMQNMKNQQQKQEKEMTISTQNPDAREKTMSQNQKNSKSNAEVIETKRESKKQNESFKHSQTKIRMQNIMAGPQIKNLTERQNQKQNTQNFNINQKYPIIANVTMVPEPQITNKSNFSNMPIKLSPITSNTPKNIDQINASFSYHPEHISNPLSLHYSSKPFVKYEKFIDTNHSPNPNYSRTYRNMDNYSALNESLKQDVNLKKNKFSQFISSNQIKTPPAKLNFIPWTQNAHKIEQNTNKPDFFFRSPNKQLLSNNFIGSPSNRYNSANSPENNLSMGRNKRINGVSGAMHPFYSPPQRKF